MSKKHTTSTEAAGGNVKNWHYDASNPDTYSGAIIQCDAELDLSSVELFGWEKYLSTEKIDQFISGINSGDSFPPVPVVNFGDHYSLAYWATRSDYPGHLLPDGGHHRSRAHLIAGSLLRVTVLGIPPASEFEYNVGFEVRNIRDIPLL